MVINKRPKRKLNSFNKMVQTIGIHCMLKIKSPLNSNRENDLAVAIEELNNNTTPKW